mgnify:CR=1 FL=1
MGKCAWEEPEYIVNLTKNLIGPRVSQTSWVWGNGEVYFDRPTDLCSFLELFVYSKLRDMTNETLGRICAYGTRKGIHSDPCYPGSGVPHSFLNLTGFDDVKPVRFVCYYGGRELLEQIACATIVCIVYDLMMQEQWQVQWAEDLKIAEAQKQYEKDFRAGNLTRVVRPT